MPQSRHASTFFGSVGSQAQLQQYFDDPNQQARRMSAAPFGTLPSDEVIANDIRYIVANSDLSAVSKKLVRQQLEERCVVGRCHTRLRTSRCGGPASLAI